MVSPVIKSLPAQQERCSIPGSGRSLEGGHGNPLQHSCLENLMDRGAWWATCLLKNLYSGQEATVRTRHGTMAWFQIGKGLRQGCRSSPCLFNFLQSTSCKMPGWMKHKLESRLLGEISITADMPDDTTLMAESEEELKSLLMKVKEESEKVGLKLKLRKLRSWDPVLSIHGK